MSKDNEFDEFVYNSEEYLKKQSKKFSKDLKNQIRNTNYLEEFALIIMNLIKEAIVLFVAIIVIINYYIQIHKPPGSESCNIQSVDNAENGNDVKSNNGNSSKVEPAQQEKPWYSMMGDSINIVRKYTRIEKGPRACLEDIMEKNLPRIIWFFKNCTSRWTSFLILIGLMYIFFNVIKTPKTLSLTNQSFDRNATFIIQDLWNKLTFVLLFPTLLIGTFSLIFISFKIMFDLPTKSLLFGYVMSLFFQIIMIALFFILFLTIGQPLYYLLTKGNISYLYDITLSDSFLYGISSILIVFLMYLGFYKLIIFNFRSTFVHDINQTKTKIFDKKILSYVFVSIIILFITLSSNIKHLFSFELWAFSVIIAGILIALSTFSYFKNVLTDQSPVNPPVNE